MQLKFLTALGAYLGSVHAQHINTESMSMYQLIGNELVSMDGETVLQCLDGNGSNAGVTLHEVPELFGSINVMHNGGQFNKWLWRDSSGNLLAKVSIKDDIVLDVQMKKEHGGQPRMLLKNHSNGWSCHHNFRASGVYHLSSLAFKCDDIDLSGDCDTTTLDTPFVAGLSKKRAVRTEHRAFLNGEWDLITMHRCTKTGMEEKFICNPNTGAFQGEGSAGANNGAFDLWETCV